MGRDYRTLLSAEAIKSVRSWDIERLAFEYRQAGRFPWDEGQLALSDLIVECLEGYQQELERLRQLARDLAAADREAKLRCALQECVDALRFIRDYDGRGLIAQHGDALEAGLEALKAIR